MTSAPRSRSSRQGPPDPLAATAGVGSVSANPRRIDVGIGVGEVRIELPEIVGVRVAPGDELRYDWMPLPSLDHDRYAATRVGIAVTFDDGSDLSASRDHYGVGCDPRAQAAAKMQWVDQWNRRRIDLDQQAGRTIRTAALVLECSPQVPLTGYLDGVAVRPAPRPAGELLDAVDTRRGTHSSDRFSRGNNAPVTARPHGGVFAIPMTDAASGAWPYRWSGDARDAKPRLQAVATSHIPSPWIGDRGVVQLMPSTLAQPSSAPHERAIAFDHDDEIARPDYYRVALEGGLTAELTAGEHAIVARFRSNGDPLRIIVDHLGEVVGATWRTEHGATTIDLLLRDGGDRPDHFAHIVAPPAIDLALSLADGRLTGHIALATSDAEVTVGMSTIDAAQARRSAHTAGSFDEVARDARVAWRSKLGAVRTDLSDVSNDTAASIAGSLARVFTYPMAYDEPGESGERSYRSPVDRAVRPGTFVATNGFWDTYRTAWPLLALLAPRATGLLADGFVQHYRDAGWVARWSAPGPVDSMTGTTSDTVFAELAAAGVAFDLETAYAAAVRHATVPAADRRVGRKGLRRGIFRGWIDTDTHEGMSWTLDNAINDSSAAVMAGLLARRPGADVSRLDAERRYFAARGLGYRHVFHPDEGFFIGRTSDGSWRVEGADFDPAEWGYDYTETNAWGTAFTAPHDGAGLVRLHEQARGPGGFGAALDEFFGTPETGAAELSGSYGFAIHEMAEAREVRMGMLGLSNQPAHHIPLMYCFVGRHDDAHRIVTEARDRLFVGSDLGQGYPGDEDNGEMSAWYLFAVLGLYPLVPASGEFVLTPPLLDRVVLHPDDGSTLEIVTTGAGKPYIRAVRIDGRPWDRITVSRARLREASRIEFDLGDEPQGWASDTRPTSLSDSAPSDPLSDLLVAVPQSPTDDRGETVTSLSAGESVTLALREESSVTLYTVTPTAGAAGLPAPTDDLALSWRLWGVASDGSETLLDERAEVFPIASQTRPFVPRRCDHPVVAMRFEAVNALPVAQLEAFHP